MDLLELFCHVDDFCRSFVPEWRQLQLASGTIRRCSLICGPARVRAPAYRSLMLPRWQSVSITGSRSTRCLRGWPNAARHPAEKAVAAS